MLSHMNLVKHYAGGVGVPHEFFGPCHLAHEGGLCHAKLLVSRRRLVLIRVRETLTIFRSTLLKGLNCFLLVGWGSGGGEHMSFVE